MIRRLTAVAAPGVLLAGIVAAIVHGGDDGPGPAQARVEVATGSVLVERADGTEAVVDDDAIVDFGDTVTVRTGSATLALADGSTYELRDHEDVASVVEVGAPPRVTSGDVLVAEGFPARIQVGGATLSALGPLKVDAEEEVAAAYGGRSTVAGAGDVTELRRLRQLVLIAGAQPEPLAYDGSDPWDRRFLGEAMAFGERLEALARGYTNGLPADRGRTTDFFRAVIPALAEERELADDLLDPARSPGETLVGAAIAVQGSNGTFRERWSEVFSFRAAGAAWGLVALDQGVSSAPVLETIEVAIATPTTTLGETSSTTAPSGTTPTTTGSTTTEPPPSTTEPDPQPPPEPSPGGLLDPPDDPSGGAVDELLGGLLETP